MAPRPRLTQVERPAPHKPTTRRTFLAASGAALATLWLADSESVRASVRYAAHAARSPERLGWETLTAEQAADVEAIAVQIFPTDEAPGAREAHVGYFIDHSLATWAAQQRDAFTAGLAELNAEVAARWPAVGRFAKLTSDQQIELLRARETTSFFRHIRLLTLVGMFSLPSYGGNADKVGWQLIGFEDRFAWQPPFGAYDAEVARDPS